MIQSRVMCALAVRFVRWNDRAALLLAALGCGEYGWDLLGNINARRAGVPVSAYRPAATAQRADRIDQAEDQKRTAENKQNHGFTAHTAASLQNDFAALLLAAAGNVGPDQVFDVALHTRHGFQLFQNIGVVLQVEFELNRPRVFFVVSVFCLILCAARLFWR